MPTAKDFDEVAIYRAASAVESTGAHQAAPRERDVD